MWNEIKFWLLAILYMTLMATFYLMVAIACLSPLVLLMLAFRYIFL